jgi:hypothetical protein
MPTNLAWTQQHGGLNVTITSKVVVYTPDEKAEQLYLFLLYPFLFLCALHSQKIHQPIGGYSRHRCGYNLE